MEDKELRGALGEIDLYLTYDGHLSSKDVDQILSLVLPVAREQERKKLLNYLKWFLWNNPKASLRSVINVIETQQSLHKEKYVQKKVAEEIRCYIQEQP